ncbi:acyl-CoA dehydrogenase family protein [Nocardia puris]|uniref:Alkylation response protein AidB-like acyl-CoA dehydrogenase n=2 Tax=Nocardia puris TaxID=208602 RepID=A0A366DU50_9NOCA|nr:acyl-CoA dehydrogenase family protein [Nocardia puris]RBO93616.1 alkylation response protein AidB-like acyl-CoA dehydrogenase [Nocardia puris]
MVTANVDDVHPMIRRAREIADNVLFPAAGEVDRRGEVPGEHWELLAREGFYGLAASAGTGELGVPEIVEILETLSGGCLSTTFVWMQHNGAVLGLAGTENTALRDRYFDGLVRGAIRAGVAFAGAVSNPAKLFAREVDGGYLLNGDAPFVSGWGVVDLLQVSARDDSSGTDLVVNGLVDAATGDGLSAHTLELVAGQATSTVRLKFEDYLLPADRVTGTAPYSDFLSYQAFGSRLNGCVACGVAGRAIRLLREAGQETAAAALGKRLDAARSALDAALAAPDTMPAARAAAADVALQAAGALVAAVGAPALLAGHTAQRLVREATFTLVAASRPDMREHLLTLLAD